MKRYVLLFSMLLSLSGYAQNTINNYKYVLVPEKFDFLKQNNQYKLNSTTRTLLENKGFTVYFDNSDLPNEIANNKCNALTAYVTEKKSMFTTKLTLSLKDCKGNVVFKSKEGISREKEFDVSYNLALQDAFTSLNDIQYAYTPATEAVVMQPATSVMPVVANTQPIVKATPAELPQTAGTLYAQPTATGYQLIDTAPKIILTLFKTSADNYFIADNGSANGIVFKRSDDWFFEYYKNGKLVAEKLSIKF